MLAPSPHEHCLVRIRHFEPREIGVALHEQAPCFIPLVPVRNLFDRQPGIDGFQLLQFGRLRSHRNRNPGVMLDIGVLLASPENQEKDVPAPIGVADDSSLRPAI